MVCDGGFAVRLSKKHWPIAAVAAIVVAVPAHADAGTAMFLLIPAHLLIGNLSIGFAEYYLLASLLRAPRDSGAWSSGWSPFTMVAANYVSAWGGVLLLATVWPQFVAQYCPEPLYQMREFLVTTWLALFVFSVLVEWPFVRWAMECITKRRWAWLSSLRGSLAVNLASYAVLTGLYFLVCPVSLATQTHIDPSLTFARGVPARVFYATEEGAVWSVRLDGSERAKLPGPRMSPRGGGLALVRNPDNSMLDLVGRSFEEPSHYVCFARGVGRVPAFPDATDRRPTYQSDSANWWATDLRGAGHSGTIVGLGRWPHEGIFCKLSGTGPGRTLLHLAIETPFVALVASHGTVLGNDLVVYGYTDSFHSDYHRVVVLDLNTRRLGVLAEGSSPVVVLDALPEGAHWWQATDADRAKRSFLQLTTEGDKP